MAAIDTERDRPSTGSTVVTPNEQREKDLEAGSEPMVVAEQSERDPDIVDWDGPDDPENPHNWSNKKKVVTVAVVAALTFVTYVVEPYSACLSTYIAHLS